MGRHYSFDLDFQRHILANFVGNEEFLKNNLGILNPDYFGNDLLKGIAECTKQFFTDHGEPPSKEALLEEVKGCVAPGRKYSEYEEEIEEVFEYIGVNSKYYQSKAREFSKVQLYSKALGDSLALAERGELDQVEEILALAKKQADGLESHLLYDFFGKLKERALSYLHPPEGGGRVSTGFYLLDDRIQCGLGVGETGVILAPPKHGKTTALISLACNALVRGKRVFYTTLELRKETVLLKFDTNLFGGLAKHFKEDKEKANEFYKAIRQLERESKGNLTVMEYPTGALTLSKLEGFIEKVKPEVVFLDYASLLRPPYKRGESRNEHSDIHKGLREIAGVCSVPIWTAHQANRPALWAKGEIGMEHISEDIQVGAIADVLISVNQSEEERRRGTLRLHILGNRLGSTGDSIEFRVNWGQSRIYDFSPEKEDLG